MDGQSIKARVRALFRQYNQPVDPALVAVAMLRVWRPRWRPTAAALLLAVVVSGCDFPSCRERCAERGTSKYSTDATGTDCRCIYTGDDAQAVQP